MKKFVTHLLLTFFIFGTATLFCQFPAGTPAQKAAAAGDLGGLDDEALQWFNEFFSQFTDEELEFFAKEGEKYIEEEMQKGKDIDTIINEVFEPFEESPAGTPEKPAGLPSLPQPAPLADIKKIDEARILLKTIVDKIEAVRHRAEHDRKSRELLAPWRFHLDDLIYFAHQLSQEKLIKYFIEKEFDDLFEVMRQLAQELSFYEPLYQVPHIAVEVENPYEILGLTPAASIDDVQERYQNLLGEKNPELIKKQMAREGRSQENIKQAVANIATEREALTQSYSTILAQEQSRQALRAVLEAFAKAVYTNDIFGKIKKLMQKYEPAALKIKEEQEKKEAAARQEQEKFLKLRSPWTPAVREPLFDFGVGGTPVPDRGIGIGSGASPYTPSTGAGVTPDAGKPSVPGAPGKAGGPAKDEKDKKAKDEKGKKEEEKKKEDVKKGKLPEVSKNVTEKLKKVDTALDNLAKYLDQKPKDRDEVSAFPDVPTKDFFKNFQTMLTQPMPTYNETEPEYMKAKAVKEALVEITKKLNDFKREIRDLRDFSKTEKAQFKKAAADKVGKFSKDYLEKYMSDVLSARLSDDGKLETPAGLKEIPKEKKYIFFGINEFDNIEDPVNKSIKELNKPQAQQIDDQSTLAPMNFIQKAKEALQAIQKELKS